MTGCGESSCRYHYHCYSMSSLLLLDHIIVSMYIGISNVNACWPLRCLVAVSVNKVLNRDMPSPSEIVSVAGKSIGPRKPRYMRNNAFPQTTSVSALKRIGPYA